MPDMTRRAVLCGVSSTTAVMTSSNFAAPSQRAAPTEVNGVIGSVIISGNAVLYGEFACRYVWGDDFMIERAVVIMDGEIQVRQLASYATGWPGNTDRRRTGLVQVGPKEWVRVPVLGRVVN
jgi:hypothetical protein